MLASLALLAALCTTAPEIPSRLIVLSWDGAPAWAIDRLLAEGWMPNLDRLQREGARAESTLPVYPTKTAVCHASLWTGAWPSRTGIVGGSNPALPAADHTLLEGRRPFDANLIQAEPFYVTAAKQGRRVAILSATHHYPPARWVREITQATGGADHYIALSGFEHAMVPSRVVRPDDFDSDGRLSLMLADTPVDLVRSPEGILVAGHLVPITGPAGRGPWSPGIPVRRSEQTSHVFLRAFAEPDGGFLLYVRGTGAVEGHLPASDREAYRAIYPAFHDFPWGLYERGELGTTLLDGGDGQAEARLLEILRFDVDLLRRASLWAWRRWHPDLLMSYSYITDSAGIWVGALDPEGPHFDPAVAARVWPVYAEVFAMHDAWLGDLMDAAPEATLVLVSDHGMAPIHWRFYPNNVLERAGLLERTPEGTIDLARTQILAPAWAGVYLKVNTTEWKGGIVDPADRTAVVERARAALADFADPRTGQRVVRRLWTPAEDPTGASGGLGGDLYLEVQDRFYPATGLGAEAIVALGGLGEGANVLFGEQAQTRGIFFLRGPTVAPGLVLPPLRMIDLAPTFTTAAGFPLPPNAQGRAWPLSSLGLPSR